MRFVSNVAILLLAAGQDAPLVADESSTSLSSTASVLSSTSLSASETTKPAVAASQCVVGLEKAGAYSCGATCNSYTDASIGTCPGNTKWSTADINGSCGATVDTACHIAVSKTQDPTNATCGNCYSMSKQVDATTTTFFAKVISVEDVKESAAKFQLPSAVFSKTCPFLCTQGGCALTKDGCSSLGGVGTFSDCVVPTGTSTTSVEKFEIKLVDCDAGKGSGAFSFFGISLASLGLVHYLMF